MAVNSVLPGAAPDYVNTTPIPPAKSSLDMAAFLNLLTTQLSNQNPLSPMDDASFFGQIAQLGNVQGMDNLNKSMQVSMASSLIGKTVTAIRPMTESLEATNSLVQGKVTGMFNQNGTYWLNLQEADGGSVQVQMGNIQSVSS